MIINPNSFLLPISSGLLFWNFADHRQFELTGEHLQRFIALAQDMNTYNKTNPIDQNFYEARIIVDHSTSSTIWGWDELSRLFHFGTRDIPIDRLPADEAEWTKAYLQHCADAFEDPFPVETCASMGPVRVKLEKPNAQSPALDLLKKRSTSRIYNTDTIPLKLLSEILFYSLGFINERALPESTKLPNSLRHRRCSPSGGGLNSTEGYIYVRNVEGLDAGIYYYNPTQHALHLCTRDLPTLGALLSGQHFINTLPVGIFLTSRLDKLWWKYKHSRTYRMALIEVGHVAQTFQLAATHFGLNTWLTGAMEECKIESLIGLKNPAEQLLFFVGAGFGVSESTPHKLANLINR